MQGQRPIVLTRAPTFTFFLTTSRPLYWVLRLQNIVHDSLHWQERIFSKKALLAYLTSGLHETCRQQLHFKCKLVAGFLLLVKEEAENKARSNKNWYGT